MIYDIYHIDSRALRFSPGRRSLFPAVAPTTPTTTAVCTYYILQGEKGGSTFTGKHGK